MEDTTTYENDVHEAFEHSHRPGVEGNPGTCEWDRVSHAAAWCCASGTLLHLWWVGTL